MTVLNLLWLGHIQRVSSEKCTHLPAVLRQTTVSYLSLYYKGAFGSFKLALYSTKIFHSSMEFTRSSKHLKAVQNTLVVRCVGLIDNYFTLITLTGLWKHWGGHADYYDRWVIEQTFHTKYSSHHANPILVIFITVADSWLLLAYHCFDD